MRPHIADEADRTDPSKSLTIPRPGEATERDALLVLWSRDEPERVGEVFFLPGAPGSVAIGRGDSSSDEKLLRSYPVRQRPGVNEPAGPLVSRRVSRVQLVFFVKGDAVEVENVGRTAMLINGQQVSRGVLDEGDIFEIRNELLLARVRRPSVLAPWKGALHPFGRADTWGLVGESPACWELRGEIAGAAAKTFHVLVRGPSGSGKEPVARALHMASSRGRRPLVARNATTIPEGIADAELFGNCRNFPNTGTPERPGLVGEAHGSTLFLDEFADLPHSLQIKLLRVLDEGKYHRLGEEKERRSDFRLIAATNRAVREIRDDVGGRLKLRIEVPDLNERRHDIPLLVRHLLRSHTTVEAGSTARDAEPRRVTAELMTALYQHRYETNIRELEGILLAAERGSESKYLELTDEVRRRLERRTPSPPAATSISSRPDASDHAFAPEQLRHLRLLRRHDFSPSACIRDPECEGNRATVDRHYLMLIWRALVHARWDIATAAALLAGPSGKVDRAAGRIHTYLQRVEARTAQAASSGLRGEELVAALVRSAKGANQDFELVVRATLDRSLTPHERPEVDDPQSRPSEPGDEQAEMAVPASR